MRRRSSSPDLYSVLPDPPCWGLLWIAPLLLLGSQSQWRMCCRGWHSAPRAGGGLFSGMRSGIIIRRWEIHSANSSARDLSVDVDIKGEKKGIKGRVTKSGLNRAPAYYYTKVYRNAGLPVLCFCFHYRENRFSNVIAEEQLCVITNSRQQYLPWQGPNMNLRGI